MRQTPGGSLWTIHQVAEYLNCSDDKALRWLRDKQVTVIDIGQGRSLLRVRPSLVRKALAGATVTMTPTNARAEQPLVYVPKYIGRGSRAASQ